MSDADLPQVEVKADQWEASFGKSAYFESAERKRGFRSSVIVTFGLMITIFSSMLFSRKSDRRESPGKSLPPPGISRDNSGINPKLLTERDLTNVIARPKVDSSSLGKIKVVSLRGISELPVGSEMNALLESGATDGIVKARLTAPLLVAGEPLLPEKAVLFGKGKSGEERLYVEFSKVIFPGGETFPIRAQAFDVSDKIQGLKGALVGTKSKKMGGAVAFGFMGGMADGLENSNGSYFLPQKPSLHDAALGGAAKAALDQSQEYMEEMKKSPNIIEVKSGTEIFVITDEPKRKDEYEK